MPALRLSPEMEPTEEWFIETGHPPLKAWYTIQSMAYKKGDTCHLSPITCHLFPISYPLSLITYFLFPEKNGPPCPSPVHESD